MEWCGQRYTYEDWPEERIISGHIVKTPPKPPKSQVLNYGLPKAKQRFVLPDQEKIWTIDAKMKNVNKTGELVEPLTKEDIEFIKSQWHLRERGCWFFNNGYLEYITGTHWFYLCYWKIKRFVEYKDYLGKKQMRWGFGLPDFTDSDRDRWLLWEEASRHEKCTGLFEITNRRDGKSERGKCTAYELSSQKENFNSAIQSKNKEDAEIKIMELVESWTEIPKFFKPVDSGYSQPKNGLHFRPPNTFSSKSSTAVSQTLKSWIKPFPATAVALDGQGIGFVYQDEVGKCEEEDVYKRYYITKPTLAVGTHILGKALLTTTVEEIEKDGVAPCKNLWDDSSLKTLNKVGMTKSGLWQYFKPAYYGFRGEDEKVKFIDDYGYSNIEAAKAYQLSTRHGLTGASLYAECRMFPHTIEEAFRSATKDSLFMINKIYEQIDYNLTLPVGLIREGLFIGDMTDMDFRFVDKEDGPFRISWMPEEKERNLRINKKPNGTTKGFFGTDPFDHNKPKGNRFSQGGIHGLLEIDPLDPIHSGGVFLEYLYRQPTAVAFYNDAIAAYVFYGMQALIERERPGLIQYIENMGMKDYAYKTNKKDYTVNKTPELQLGINTSGIVVRESMMSGLAEYIADYVGLISEEVQRDKYGIEYHEGLMGRFPFKETLDQIIEFDPSNWEKYDGVVSLMLAVLARNDSKKKWKAPPVVSTKGISAIFGSFDNSGQVSRRI